MDPRLVNEQKSEGGPGRVTYAGGWQDDRTPVGPVCKSKSTFMAALVYLDRERPTELVELPCSAPSAPTTLRRPITIAGEHFFEVFQLTSAAEMASARDVHVRERHSSHRRALRLRRR